MDNNEMCNIWRYEASPEYVSDISLHTNGKLLIITAAVRMSIYC